MNLFPVVSLAKDCGGQQLATARLTLLQGFSPGGNKCDSHAGTAEEMLVQSPSNYFCLITPSSASEPVYPQTIGQIDNSSWAAHLRWIRYHHAEKLKTSKAKGGGGGVGVRGG